MVETVLTLGDCKVIERDIAHVERHVALLEDKVLEDKVDGSVAIVNDGDVSRLRIGRLCTFLSGDADYNLFGIDLAFVGRIGEILVADHYADGLTELGHVDIDVGEELHVAVLALQGVGDVVEIAHRCEHGILGGNVLGGNGELAFLSEIGQSVLSLGGGNAGETDVTHGHFVVADLEDKVAEHEVDGAIAVVHHGNV